MRIVVHIVVIVFIISIYSGNALSYVKEYHPTWVSYEYNLFITGPNGTMKEFLIELSNNIFGGKSCIKY